MTYLTDEQVKLLLRPIHPQRVLQRDRMSYVEGYDIRAELNRVFGFGRWSEEVLDQALICETEKKTNAGREAWYVVYRTRLRLTVNAPDGTYLAHYDGSHVGESTHPVRGEAHGNALTNSETYALRRCAINLGDQFGLSLYNKGSLEPIVRWTLVRPEAGAEPADTDDVPQVSAEDSGSSSAGNAEPRDSGEALDNAEPVTAPRDVSKPAIAGGASLAGLPWAEDALGRATRFGTPAEGAALWKETAAKERQRQVSHEDAERIRDLITARVDDLRKAEAAEILKALDPADSWRLKAEGVSDEEEARRALEELGREVSAGKVDLTRANRVSRALIVRFPKAGKREAEAA